MRCDEVGERLVELLYDEVGTPRAGSELRAHVDSCAACEAELRELQATRRLLREWPDEPAPRRIVPAVVPLAAAGRRSRLARVARYGAVAAMLLVTLLALANTELTWSREAGFALRTHLLRGPSRSGDVPTRAEVRALLRQALDDTESRMSEETMMVGQRVLDTIEAERRVELRLLASRLRRTGGNN
jgi:anti-sigma factor RsiW